jgi:hypothetical protein
MRSFRHIDIPMNNIEKEPVLGHCLKKENKGTGFMLINH